jgi:DNA-directed RNA polymerase specialized sigma subunit
MDLIQIAAEGLMSAVDKFVLPYSPVFRSVAIGRMVGNFIEQTSETMVHFYPTDKRKIYRANKALGRLKDGFNYEYIASEVNKGVDEARHTNAEEIADLLSAVSCVSADARPATQGGETGEGILDRFAVLAEQQPDNLAETNETIEVMHGAMTFLSTFEMKVLRLHGVDLLS